MRRKAKVSVTDDKEKSRCTKSFKESQPGTIKTFRDQILKAENVHFKFLNHLSDSLT